MSKNSHTKKGTDNETSRIADAEMRTMSTFELSPALVSFALRASEIVSAGTRCLSSCSPTFCCSHRIGLLWNDVAHQSRRWPRSWNAGDQSNPFSTSHMHQKL